MIGIYRIINKKNNKSYIGSSIDIENRWSQHKNSLKTNSHVNSYLQNAWNKYGEYAFEFKIEKEVSEDVLRSVEQEYLEKANFDSLYNISTSAYGPSQEYRMNEVCLLDLQGNLIKTFKCGAELARHIGYKRQLSYSGINTSRVTLRKYRIVTPEFYKNNLDIIKSWPNYFSKIKEVGRVKLLNTKIYILNDDVNTIYTSLDQLGKYMNLTRERMRQIVRDNKVIFHVISKNIIEVYYVHELLEEDWFLKSEYALNLFNQYDLKKLIKTKSKAHLHKLTKCSISGKINKVKSLLDKKVYKLERGNAVFYSQSIGDLVKKSRMPASILYSMDKLIDCTSEYYNVKFNTLTVKDIPKEEQIKICGSKNQILLDKFYLFNGKTLPKLAQ